MITVLSPGARTLIEDAGRPGYEHLGVPTSGAADLPALRLANLLVGNPATAPAFEVAAHGPTLRFTADAVIAYAGPDADLWLDDRLVPTRHTVRVRAGQTLSVGALRGGVYGYLAVAGTLDVPVVLGSASSCTMSGLGSPVLCAGQSLTVIAPEVAAADGFAHPALAGTSVGASRLRVLPGPHEHLFTGDTLDGFYAARWSVSPMSSRVGVRLDGERALTVEATSLPSMGMVTGAIQVPPNGMPIVLGPDHGTVGGYPVVGVVHPDDMPTLMQRPSGAPVLFVRTAHDALRQPSHEATTVLRNHAVAAAAG